MYYDIHMDQSEGLQGQKITIDRERTREMKESDRQKILTRRGLERTFRDGGGNFEEFFGLDNVMKAFLRLNKDNIESNFFWKRDRGDWIWHHDLPDEENNRVSINQLCLEEARLRKQVRSENQSLDASNIETETLRLLMNKYSPNGILNFDLAEEVKKEPSDRVLNIGDPDHATNKQLDREGVVTIDYEDGFDARARGSKKVSDITSDLDEHLGFDEREKSFCGATKQLDEWCYEKPGENVETDWYCDPRQLPEGFFPMAKKFEEVSITVKDISTSELLSGYPDEEPTYHLEKEVVCTGYETSIEEVKTVATGVVTDPEKIRGVGIIFLESIAERLAKELETNPTPENMDLAKQAWNAVKIKLDQNPRNGVKYDTSEGYHPFENLTFTLSETANNATLGLEVLKVYQTEIFPEIIQKHLEDLADIHVNTITESSKYDQKQLQYYRGLWGDFLQSKGVNPEKFHYDDPDSHFVDLLVQFFLINGISSLRNLAPDFFEEVEKEEKQKIREKIPQSTSEKEAKFIEMMFPQTQELPAHSYDRVVMSWSWSAHMLQDMTTEELVGVVWPELDRLLATNGIANIFPIGHHGVNPEWVEQTIKSYIEKTGVKWQVDISRPCAKPTDNEDSVYRLLQIKKLD